MFLLDAVLTGPTTTATKEVVVDRQLINVTVRKSTAVPTDGYIALEYRYGTNDVWREVRRFYDEYEGTLEDGDPTARYRFVPAVNTGSWYVRLTV